MDGHTDVVSEPVRAPDARDEWCEGAQRELFEGQLISFKLGTGRLADDTAFGAPSASIFCPLPSDQFVSENRCAGLVSAGSDFFNGSCVPEMGTDARGQFFDNCLRAQDNERLKMGRELHDSTGQLLLVLRLEIARLRQVRGTAEEESLLDEIDHTAREIDREIRAFAFTHYPAEIGREGLGPALLSLVRGFARRTGLRIAFRSLPDPLTNTGAAALGLLRVAQEALVNVHRHARAVHVSMALTLREGMLELSVKDDGVGIPLAHGLKESHGVGLQGMRHRVERLGGHFAIKRLKRGTKLIAAVPA